jgi:hypothetical protein
VEANLSNIARGVEEIKTYLYKGSDRHTEIISRLAVIDSKQNEYAKYQQDCESDRGGHEKRLTAVETYQTGQRKTIATLSAVISTIIALGIELFRR